VGAKTLIFLSAIRCCSMTETLLNLIAYNLVRIPKLIAA
jgi:hypothetical protein